jgi:hypothetical protein
VSSFAFADEVTQGRNVSVFPSIQIEENRFRYTGNFTSIEIYSAEKVEKVTPLQSGKSAFQIGILACRRDPCNFVAGMIEFEDNRIRLKLQRKSNPNNTKSKECGNNGYSISEYSEWITASYPLVISHKHSNETISFELKSADNSSFVSTKENICYSSQAIRSDNMRWKGKFSN